MAGQTQGEDEQVLAGFIVQRRITKTLPAGRPIGDPLWSLEIRYEGEGRVTTLEHHNLDTEEAQDRILALVREMGE